MQKFSDLVTFSESVKGTKLSILSTFARSIFAIQANQNKFERTFNSLQFLTVYVWQDNRPVMRTQVVRTLTQSTHNMIERQHSKVTYSLINTLSGKHIAQVWTQWAAK